MLDLEILKLCLQRTTHYSLLTTHCSLLAAHCSLLTYSLLTTHYFTHYSLLTVLDPDDNLRVLTPNPNPNPNP